jgi:ribosomal protein S24E
MEFKTIEQKKNPLLHREEYRLSVKSEANPSFADIKKHIDKDENLIVVKKIAGNFGKQQFDVEAVVYDSEENKKKIEVIPRKVRKKMAEEKKKADEAAKAAQAAPAQ